MDIKPGNIFLSRETYNPSGDEGETRNHSDSADDGFDEHEDETPMSTEITYKIGN